jgi:hypothetical protein
MSAHAAAPKRPYHIPADVATNRGRLGALARNSVDTYIGSLEKAAAELTTAQRRRLALLLMPFLSDEAGTR